MPFGPRALSAVLSPAAKTQAQSHGLGLDLSGSRSEKAQLLLTAKRVLHLSPAELIAYYDENHPFSGEGDIIYNLYKISSPKFCELFLTYVSKKLTEPERMSTKKTILRHIILKLLKTKR